MSKNQRLALEAAKGLEFCLVVVTEGFRDRSSGKNVPIGSRGKVSGVCWTVQRNTLQITYELTLNYESAPMGSIHVHNLSASQFGRYIKVSH